MQKTVTDTSTSEEMAFKMLDAEKVEQIELAHPGDGLEPVSYTEGRKIVHKIDWRLITALGLMFAVSLMDRNNMGSANIAGMAQQLHLEVGFRFSTVILLFFVPYLVFQWPSALLARKIGPRIFLPAVTFAWGVTMIGMGFVKNWGALAALRVVVGLFEAGLFPGALYLLQMWYCRYDVHKRYSSFYLISVVGSSLSGVMAYGFMQMGGVGGYLGWTYIFVWEGVLTCAIALIGAYLIVDFPQEAQNSRNFLTPDELAYVIRLLERDRRDAHHEPFSWGQFLRSGLDMKIWFFAILFFCSTMMAYSISFFLPIILNQKMGYGVGVSQVLSTPPNFFAAACMYFEAWLGDKYHIRGPIIFANALIAVCGLCLQAWSTAASTQYLGVFLVCAGSNSTIPTVMAYQANNIRGQWKRAFASASLITLGASGGIVGALVFRSQDSPQYLPGIYASLASCAIALAVVTGLMIYFRKKNKEVDSGQAVIEGLPGFHYTL
ncbi:hypothetical protein CLAIMM_08187 [Cladophialophora immunda]|nr:hypothetical protein CLAIMM_08187 [Cladophialophora immunda]